MQKYKFSVSLQRNKHKVDVQISGFDLKDAERKLRQMYPHGEVTHCGVASLPGSHTQALDISAALSLIAGEYQASTEMCITE